jgi:hypothetical protein
MRWYIMDKNNLVKLAERCEAAVGPDRELDADICIAALGWSEIPSEEGDWRSLKGPSGRINVTRNGSNGGFAGDKLPKFTASLDAAMTLVPEGWAIQSVRSADGMHGGANLYFFADSSSNEPTSRAAGNGKTPALALCAAALRSHAQPK